MGKFALRALGQSLAREFHPQGIHVAHVIVDGQIKSERWGSGQLGCVSSLSVTQRTGMPQIPDAALLTVGSWDVRVLVWQKEQKTVLQVRISRDKPSLAIKKSMS